MGSPAQDGMTADRAGLLLLVGVALAGGTVTYQQFADITGGIARGQGPRLNRIGAACFAADVPLLSILVVAGDSGLPSTGASFYADRGILSEEAIRDEIARCGSYAWNAEDIRRVEEKLE